MYSLKLILSNWHLGEQCWILLIVVLHKCWHNKVHLDVWRFLQTKREWVPNNDNLSHSVEVDSIVHCWKSRTQSQNKKHGYSVEKCIMIPESSQKHIKHHLRMVSYLDISNSEDSEKDSEAWKNILYSQMLYLYTTHLLIATTLVFWLRLSGHISWMHLIQRLHL